MSLANTNISNQAIIHRYIQATLRSKLSSLNIAEQLGQPKIFLKAAIDFTEFSRDIYSIIQFLPTIERGDSHRGNLISDYLKKNGASITRSRRFPLIRGNELAQLVVISNLISNCNLSIKKITINCRQRTGQFVLTIQCGQKLPLPLRTLVRGTQPDRILAHHLSQLWLKHYAWLQQAKHAGLKINMSQNSSSDISISFQCVQQLSLPLFNDLHIA